MGYDLGDFLKDVKGTAPLLAKAAKVTGVGGPVVDLIAGALGVDTNGKSEGEITSALSEAIRTDPEAAAKLLELQNTHKVKLEDIRLQEAQMYLSDRQSARQRESDIVLATKSKDWFVYAFASLIVTGFFASLIVFMTYDIPEANNGAVNMITGAIIGSFTAVVGYFFGSSKSSSDKTQLMANMSNQDRSVAKETKT